METHKPKNNSDLELNTTDRIPGMVSVITPTFNRANTLPRSIYSVLNQTYSNIELIIVDDASSDGTLSIVDNISDERVICIKNKANMGACYARNIGIRKAKGEFLAFLDSDNEWDAEYINSRMLFFHKDASLGGLFGMARIIDDDYTRIFPPRVICERMSGYTSNDEFLREMLFGNVVDTNTIILRASTINGMQGFNESLKRLQDWEFFFRVIKSSDEKIMFLDNCLVTNYIQSDSLGKNDEEYWKSIRFFISEYKDEYLKRGCLEDAVYYQLMNYDVRCNANNVQEVIKVLDSDEIDSLINLIRNRNRSLVEVFEKYTRNTKIRMIQTKWLSLKMRGRHLETVLLDMGLKNIVIYGYGVLGELLLNELIDGKCSILGIKDRKMSEGSARGVPFIELLPDCENVDAFIVTAVSDFDEIKKNNNDDERFISLEEIINRAAVD